MTRKTFKFTLIAVLLVFSMVILGCPDGNGNTDPALNGTWASVGGGGRMYLHNGSFTMSYNDNGTFKDTMRGTYTTSGNTMTSTVTLVHRNNLMDESGELPPGFNASTEWFNYSQYVSYYRDIYKSVLDLQLSNNIITQAQYNESLAEFDTESSASRTSTYAISGDTLTVTTTNGPDNTPVIEIYTRVN